MRGMADRHGWIIVTATQLKRCLTLDSIIDIENKGKTEIRYLNEGDKILTDDGFKVVDKIHPIEKQKVFLVKTKSGKTIKMSANHITPTSKCNKLTSELVIGDSIYIKREPQI